MSWVPEAGLAEVLGNDPEVRARILALEAAMRLAAAKAGQKLKTISIMWITDSDGDGVGGSMLWGDDSPEVLEFLADMILDDDAGVEVPDMKAVLQ